MFCCCSLAFKACRCMSSGHVSTCLGFAGHLESATIEREHTGNIGKLCLHHCKTLKLLESFGNLETSWRDHQLDHQLDHQCTEFGAWNPRFYTFMMAGKVSKSADSYTQQVRKTNVIKHLRGLQVLVPIWFLQTSLTMSGMHATSSNCMIFV